MFWNRRTRSAKFQSCLQTGETNQSSRGWLRRLLHSTTCRIFSRELIPCLLQATGDSFLGRQPERSEREIVILWLARNENKVPNSTHHNFHAIVCRRGRYQRSESYRERNCCPPAIRAVSRHYDFREQT